MISNLIIIVTSVLNSEDFSEMQEELEKEEAYFHLFDKKTSEIDWIITLLLDER